MYEFTDACNHTQNVTVSKSDPIFWLEIIGIPSLIAVCTIGNVLNIVVMSFERPQLASAQIVSKSTKVFLLAMAFSDMILLWLQLPRYLGDFVHNITDQDFSNFAVGFKTFYGAQTWWSSSAITFCDWVLIAFSIDRMRSIHSFLQSFKYLQPHDPVVEERHPQPACSSSWSERSVFIEAGSCCWWSSVPGQRTKQEGSRQGLRRRTAVKIVILTLFGSLLFAIENGVFFFYYVLWNPKNGQAYHEFRPDWLTNWHFYQKLIEVVMTCAKFCILSTINVHLVVILMRQERQAFLATTTEATTLRIHHSRREGQKDSTGNRLLIGCLFVYFITHFPSVVYQVVRLMASPPYCLVFFTVDCILVARPILRIVLYSNYSINFLLYYGLSRKFREQLRILPLRLRAWKMRFLANFLPKLGITRCRKDTGYVRRTPLTANSSTSSNSSTCSNASVVTVRTLVVET